MNWWLGAATFRAQFVRARHKDEVNYL